MLASHLLVWRMFLKTFLYLRGKPWKEELQWSALPPWPKSKLGQVNLWAVSRKQTCLCCLWGERGNFLSVLAHHSLPGNSPCLHSDMAVLDHSLRERGRKMTQSWSDPFPLFLQSPTSCDCSLVSGSWEGPKSALHTRSMGPGHEQGGLWPPVSLSWQPLLPASSPQALQSRRGLPHPVLSTPVTPIPISLQQNVSALCTLSLRDEGLRQPCWNTNTGDRAERVTHRRRQQSGYPLRWLGSRNAGGAGYVIPHSLSYT